MTAWAAYLERQEEDRLRRLRIVHAWATTAHDVDLAAQADREIRTLTGKPA